jgi:hypothetical protein
MFFHDKPLSAVCEIPPLVAAQTPEPAARKSTTLLPVTDELDRASNRK